jgi:hypothetical protein
MGHHGPGTQRTVAGGGIRVASEQAAVEEAAQLRITRQLVEPLEWAGFAYQGAVLIQTALVDPFNQPEKTIVLLLGVAHLALAAFFWRTRGPFTRSGYAMALWVAGAFAVPVIIALLAAPGTYASNTSCVQACTYPAAPLFFVALCPWIFARALARPAVGLGLVAAACLEWFLLIYLINGGFTRTSTLSALSSIIWAVVAYGLGRVVARLAGVVRKGEIQVQEQKNEEFFDFLHSHIKAGLAAVKLEQPDVPAMLEKVGELEHTVSEQRITQLLSMDRVPIAMLCSERIRAFTGVIQIAETPRSGARTVRGPVGTLIDRALGDLLKNAVVHGAATAWVRMAPLDDMLLLEVADDGPGFDEAVMDNPGTSLHRLRAKARELGGDLVKAARSPRGSRLTLTVPAYEDR